MLRRHDFPAFSRGPRPRFAALLLAATLLPGAAWAEYRLAAGDVVEIAVVGVPDLRQRAPVNIDGDVSVPLAGGIRAVGLTIPELRAKVQDAISSKVLNQRGADGRMGASVIAPEEVSVSIVEYRPVYLNGDVSRPGELTYRPGLTVRQAVSLAGGYDLARFRMGNPMIEAADFRAEYDSLSSELARTVALVARLRAEAGLPPEPEVKGEGPPAVPPQTLASIRAVAADQMKVRREDQEKERAYLKGLVEQEDKRIASLREQREKELAGTEADGEDLERVELLFKRGAVPITRLTDARRLILLSSTRALQTGVQLAGVERERQEASRKLQRIDDARRLEVLPELQEAQVRLAATRAKLQAVAEKLLYTSVVRSQLTRGKGAEPQIALVRGSGAARARLPATEDTALLPGDVVEISLRSELLAGIEAP